MAATNMCSNFGSKWSSPPKEIQKVPDLPELKIVKPSDTRWLITEYPDSDLEEIIDV